jgi:hypothetical protein
MRKALRIILFTIIGIVVALGILVAVFIYKVKNGFPVSYETEKPSINFPKDQPAILLFSKTSGYRHSDAIDASKVMFADLAKKNHWFLYETEEGGVFNPEQLSQFKVVIFNNSTGEVINAEQKTALENFVEKGGSLLGIHGAGDDSHHWDWYEKNLLGAKFSHHPIKNHLQETQVILKPLTDSTLWSGLSPQWKNTDEWYVFFENPLKKGFTGIYTIDGESINPDGNILFVTSKTFGMGKEHPVAWYKMTEKGRTFYTSMGHDGSVYKKPEMIKLLEWGIRQ